MEGNLTKGPILKTLTKLAVPIMASAFLGTLYNITDMAWIGLLGSRAVAGVGVGGMFTWLSQGLAAMARMGGQVQVAQCIGRGERERAHGFAQAAVQLSAFMVCVAAWLFTGRQSIGALWQIENKYTLLGGVIGAFITITVIQSMGALGPAKAAMLIVISQLIVAYVIELLGMFGVEREPFVWRKVLGMLIAIAGIVIFKWE